MILWDAAADQLPVLTLSLFGVCSIKQNEHEWACTDHLCVRAISVVQQIHRRIPYNKCICPVFNVMRMHICAVREVFRETKHDRIIMDS